LGTQCVFDREGDLKQMVLRQDRDVSFKLQSKSYRKRVPGYAVAYEYGTQTIGGHEHKVLTSIKQDNCVAWMDWHSNGSAPQIVGIRVSRRGQTEPVEALRYEYGTDGMLARIWAGNGRRVSIRYEENNTRVVTAPL